MLNLWLSSVIVFHVSDLYCNGDSLLFIVFVEAAFILYSGWIIFFLKPHQVLLCFFLVYSFTLSFDNDDDDNNTLFKVQEQNINNIISNSYYCC